MIRRALAASLGAMADALIAPSFAASGYWLRRWTWRDPDLNLRLDGRRYLITGANTGLGRAATEALLVRGATVHMLCRDPDRAQAARAEILNSLNDPSGTELAGRIILELCDVSELARLHELCQRLRRDLSKLDGLVLNAGVLPLERGETSEGVEKTWATNVLAPHLMTRELQGLLAGARIVWVSSGGMYSQKLDLEDWDWRRRPFDGVRAYAMSKRAEVVLAELWSQTLAGAGTLVNSMHPGWADTQGIQTSLPGFRRWTRPFLRSWAQGADTIVWLVASPEASPSSGEFFLDRRPQRKHLAWLKTRHEPDLPQKLWDHCEAQIKACLDKDQSSAHEAS